MKPEGSCPHHVVVIGGGFAGLYAAKALRRASVKVTLIDRRNFHLFQPLLYQVATGSLSPGDIASSLRAVLGRYRNVRVLLGEMVDIAPDEQKVILADGETAYDSLVIATGVQPHYFGYDAWAKQAPGLKTVEDGLRMRRRILHAFEAAERETDPEKRRAWMTFVVIGGGSAGVELSGALGELAHGTLRNEFRNINSTDAKVLLLERVNRILPAYPPWLSARAEAALVRLGVTVQTGTSVVNIADDTLTVDRDDQIEEIQARTIMWMAGVIASPIAQVLSRRAGARLDRLDRVVVESDLTVAGHPNIFVIGDLASCAPQGGDSLPAVAPVAMQEGRYVAKLIRARLQSKSPPPFRYSDRGTLAVIGRNAAVAQLGPFRFAGFLAWLLWVFVHIIYLIEFDNRVLVMFRWTWNYATRRRGARLITGEPNPF